MDTPFLITRKILIDAEPAKSNLKLPRGQPLNDMGLNALLKKHEGDDAKWQMIRKKYLSLLGS